MATDEIDGLLGIPPIPTYSSRLYPERWQSVYEELVRLGFSPRDAEDMLEKVTRPEDALAMFMEWAEEDSSW